ncbi:hypothetical protein L873DRAFT_1713537 [Choiromyces venosus 120613-1]|uniref:TPR-like protein n=1 Tax=Choiromyces venosus 120613-1 TaxID=1336337 RepID=A0A3N4J3B2_9PEZI|nr:hypothetical protein L873DRAFT_1713537 [Choiromyces venosus 120613-1]
MHRRALESTEKVLGPDHPETLASVNNLASVLQDLGRYAESETMHRRALESTEKVLGPDHPETLAIVNNLALVLRDLGRYAESARLSRRALEGRKRFLGRTTHIPTKRKQPGSGSGGPRKVR